MAIRVQYMKNISFSRVFLLSSSEEQGRIDFEFQGSAQDWKATPCWAVRAGGHLLLLLRGVVIVVVCHHHKQLQLLLPII